MVKTLTWKEAVQQEKESYERMEREIEEHRRQEAEEYRRIHETTIICAHRDNQDYIKVSDFGLTLCSDCIKALALALKGLEADGS